MVTPTPAPIPLTLNRLYYVPTNPEGEKLVYYVGPGKGATRGKVAVIGKRSGSPLRWVWPSEIEEAP